MWIINYNESTMTTGKVSDETSERELQSLNEAEKKEGY